ncbi:MAG: primosomal protein N' [Nitrospinales bacterium]
MKDEQNYIDVVFNLPLKDPFTYKIPPALTGLVHVGMRVFAPFGRRKLTGYVVALRGKPEGKFTVKSIEDLPDNFPVITPELLSLTKWIADYYRSSWGEGIKAALPAGADDEGREILTLTKTGIQALKSGSANSSAIHILKTLQNKPKLTAKQIQRLIGKNFKSHTLARLKHDQWIACETQVKQSLVGYAYIKMVKAASNIDPGQSKKMLSRSPKQNELFDIIKIKEQEVSALTKETPSRTNLLKELEKKGLVEIFQIKTDRSNLGAEQKKTYGNEKPPVFTKEQQSVFSELNQFLNTGKFQAFLLHGVTGSGKTEIYLRCIEQAISLGKTGIMMVPEISLTPQTVNRFQNRFGNQVAILHSGLSNSERYLEWKKIRDGKVLIAVGARSSVFAPFKNLGVIIIDEEHDSSYKQDSVPRYHARDTAIVRARAENAVVILGSATPSMESKMNAESGKYGYLSLTKRVGSRLLPGIKLVDMTHEKGEKKNFSILSGQLKSAILHRLKEKEQSFLFLNRRGTANYVSCKTCGFVFHCLKCSVTLTFHNDQNVLRCHYCGQTARPPATCPDCHGDIIRFSGFGTKKLEAEIRRMFPGANVTRMDRDTARGKTAFDLMYSGMHAGEIDILIGTQMITKGHDFPNVTLVGVINADISLNIPDFRSCERSFQLLTQVAGRAGRGNVPGQVIIQTHNPDHYLYEYVKNHDFDNFYDKEIRIRERLNFPPFTRLASIEVESEIESMGIALAGKLKISLEKIIRKTSGIELLGPSRAALYMINNRYRWHIILRAKGANELQNVLSQCGELNENKKNIPAKTKVTIDVDPINML